MKKPRIKTVVEVGIILILIFVSAFTDDLFPGTTFAKIINKTLGRFFNFTDFFQNNYMILLESLTIIIFTWVILKIASWIFMFFIHRNPKSNMIELAAASVRYLIYIMGLVLILGAFGIDSTAILATVGIVGIAISFGAQGVIEDVISGLFILIDKPFVQGDIVYVDGFQGVVEKIGLRTTRFTQLLTNDTKILNNSSISGIMNTTHNDSTVVCDLSVSYNTDIRWVEDIIDMNKGRIRKAVPQLLEDLRYAGVSSLGDSAVNLRYVAKVKEGDRGPSLRLLNREFKILFDEYDIEIPFPQLVMHKYELEPTPIPKHPVHKKDVNITSRNAEDTDGDAGDGR